MRLSTSEEQQATSFDVQLEAISDYAASKGLVIDGEFKDTVSGSSYIDKRPGMIQMFDTLKKGDIVLVHKMDRLSRNNNFSGWVNLELKRMQVELVYVNMPDRSDDPMSALMESMLSAFAQFEREMIVSRIKASKQLQKSRGQFLGGKPPYGYDVEEREGVKYLVENEVEQTAIALMRDMREDGSSFVSISTALMKQGINTRLDTPFAAMQIKRALEYVA